MLNVDDRQDRARRPHPDDARQRPRGGPGGLRRRHRRRRRHQADRHRRHARRAGRPDQARERSSSPSRSSRSRSSRRRSPTRRRCRSRWAASPRRTRRSRSRPTRRPARPRSPGMGELHLEVLVDRMMREFKRRGERRQARRSPTARPIARRRPRRSRASFVRQTGGSGQYGVVYIDIEPAPGEGFDFVYKIKGGSDPVGVHPGGREGRRGGAGHRRQGRLPDGRRPRDARPTASTTTRTRRRSRSRSPARSPSRRPRAAPSPSCSSRSSRSRSSPPRSSWATSSATSTAGAAASRAWSRRGNALAVTAHVPLSEMFGYATDLRSKTQGRATYTMQFEQLRGGAAEHRREDRRGPHAASPVAA